MRSGRFVCHSVYNVMSVILSDCMQDYCKSSHWCYDCAYKSEEAVNFFGGDSVPATNSGSLFHFLTIAE